MDDGQWAQTNGGQTGIVILPNINLYFLLTLNWRVIGKLPRVCKIWPKKMKIPGKEKPFTLLKYVKCQGLSYIYTFCFLIKRGYWPYKVPQTSSTPSQNKYKKGPQSKEPRVAWLVKSWQSVNSNIMVSQADTFSEICKVPGTFKYIQLLLTL